MKTAQEYQLDDIPQAMPASQAGHHYSFYNLSRHNLKTITNDPDTLSITLRDYINKFSANVRDIFEKLIRKFAEASNETAGEHFTPREVIELMVTLLLADDKDLRTDFIVREVYDPTAGTGGMLSVAEEKIKAINPNADVILLGQELNPESYAICKADMVVKGQEVDSIVLGNTLTAPASGRIWEEKSFFSLPTIVETLNKKEITISGESLRKFNEIFAKPDSTIKLINFIEIPNYLHTEILALTISGNR